MIQFDLEFDISPFLIRFSCMGGCAPPPLVSTRSPLMSSSFGRVCVISHPEVAIPGLSTKWGRGMLPTVGMGGWWLLYESRRPVVLRMRHFWRMRCPRSLSGGVIDQCLGAVLKSVAG